MEDNIMVEKDLRRFNGHNVSYDGKGYAIICDKKHLNAPQNGILYVHRLVAEEKLGRKLNDKETVHHIDENKANWKPDNLMIFDTSGDHAAFHKGVEAIYNSETGTYHCEKPIIIHNTPKNACPICGKLKNKYAKACFQCSSNHKKDSEKPNKETLEILIKTYPFVKIGEMYGVTDRAVRKWCEMYGLPSRKRDIKIAD